MCSHVLVLAMLLVHHRVKLISVFVDRELHVIAQQRHNAGAPLRLVPPSVKTAEKRIILIKYPFISL